MKRKKRLLQFTNCSSQQSLSFGILHAYTNALKTITTLGSDSYKFIPPEAINHANSIFPNKKFTSRCLFTARSGYSLHRLLLSHNRQKPSLLNFTLIFVDFKMYKIGSKNQYSLNQYLKPQALEPTMLQLSALMIRKPDITNHHLELLIFFDYHFFHNGCKTFFQLYNFKCYRYIAQKINIG